MLFGKYTGKEAYKNIKDPVKPQPKIGDVYTDPETGDTIRVIDPVPYKYRPHGGMYIGLRHPRKLPNSCK